MYICINIWQLMCVIVCIYIISEQCTLNVWWNVKERCIISNITLSCFTNLFIYLLIYFQFRQKNLLATVHPTSWKFYMYLHVAS